MGQLAEKLADLTHDRLLATGGARREVAAGSQPLRPCLEARCVRCCAIATTCGSDQRSDRRQGRRHVQLWGPTVPGVLRRSRQPSASLMGVSMASDPEE